MSNDSCIIPTTSEWTFLLAYQNWGDTPNEPVLALVDTGATKCQIPREFNDTDLGLPIGGRDSNVQTASGLQSYDYVTIPRVTLVKQEIVGNFLRIQDTDLQEPNVQAWLGESFIVGMNLVTKFDITLRRDGRIIVER